ncbi:MAG: ParM/StbA family protein [Lyngbya sp.]|nr:ParM/StbA family protein [Lyngbya sp.]
MDEVNLSIDLGSSLTKAVWSWGGCQDTCNFLTMEPEVLPCGSDHLDAYRSKRVNLYATTREDLWVKLNKGDENAYAVGFLAQSLLAHVNLKALKYESALHKILAVTGAIAQQQQATSLTVNLAVLLPWSEWSDRKKLGEQVGKALKSFWFRGTHYRIALKQWNTLPEGAGVTINRCAGLSQATKTIVTLVFGHRNTSCLVFERGMLVEGDTTNLGFYRLIEKIMSQTSGQNRHQLTQSIYQLGNPFNPENPLINSLCKSKLPNNQKREVQELIAAIAQAQKSYWGLVNQWLIAKVPDGINEIVVAGGTAKYLYSHLCQQFSGISAYWGTDWQERIENNLQFQSLDLHEKDRESLAFRLVDVYAHHQLQLQFLNSLSSTQAATH